MSLLAWYPLISNGNNHGLDGINLTTVGTVTYTAGKLGNASTFTNNSGIRFRRANFTEQTGWSVSAWVKCSAATSASQWAFNNGRDSNNDGWHCYFNAAGTTLYLRIGSSSWSMTSTLGTWYHVCMTIDDNSKYTFYVNGAQVSTGTVATLPDYSESGNLMAIGGFVYNGGNIYPLNGQVQDFRYYNHVLSKREVKEISKGLCLHVPLDFGGNPNILPDTPVATNPTENNSVLGRTVYVRSTTATGESYIWSGRSDVVTGSTKYTFSAWVWVNDYVKSVDFYWLSTNTTNKKTGTAYDNVTSSTGKTPTPNTWTYMTWTFTTPSTDYTGVIRVDNNGSKTEGTAAILKVYNMKLEKGEQATPFIPHTSDSSYSKGFNTIPFEDKSGFKRTLTKLSEPTNGGVAPKRTSCTYFDGTDDGVQISLPSLNNVLSDKFTISFWIKPVGEAGARSVYFGSNGDVAFIFNIEKNASNQLRYYWNIGSPDYNNTAFTIADDVWQHIAVVRESATSTKFYKNGTLINTYTTNCPAITNTNSTFYLGRDNRTGATCYKGYMSDFRLYATAFTADEIKALYSIPAEIDKTGKVYCRTLVEG